MTLNENPAAHVVAPGARPRSLRTLPAGEEAHLRDAIHGLREQAPKLSAHQVLTRRQGVVAVIGLVLLLGLGIIWPFAVLRAVIGLIILGYVVTLVYRILLFAYGTRGGHIVRISDDEALALTEDELPRYTVLVPAFREPLVGELIDNLAALDYPPHLLDIRLLLEADDVDTVTAARDSNPPDHVSIVLVPPSEPRTKPKACNFGMADADGDIVTIYDAEDLPDPLQLRRAVLALRELGGAYACVQAKLNYFNADQNLLTRWFTVEYGTWFAYLLPGLVALNAPLPLGGTSNHFRADVLREVGGWDPFNVTEDADLGVRLHRAGYRVGVLDSVTLEEANSDPINWIKQRSRWYKGYLQSFLVHVREPVKVAREIGASGMVGLTMFIAGTPLLTACNLLFWVLTAMWFAGEPSWIAQLFPPVVYYLGLACFVLGNFAVVYMSVFAVRHMRRPDLLGAALLTPLYWVLMSLAAIKAVVQLVFQPSYWEKTTHGLHKPAGGDAMAGPHPLLASEGGQA